MRAKDDMKRTAQNQNKRKCNENEQEENNEPPITSDCVLKQNCHSRLMPNQINEPRKKRKKETNNTLSGRWTAEEHQAFLEGLKLHGREWKKVAERIPSRTSAQIRSHAQKYFSKLSKDEVLQSQHIISPSSSNAAVIENIAEVPIGQQNITSNTLARISQIMNDPNAVEEQVQRTLSSLHERYRHLQSLVISNQLGAVSPRTDMKNVRSIPTLHLIDPVPDLQDRDENKEQPEDLTEKSREISETKMKIVSPMRSFESKELIALQVLGGSLKNDSSDSEDSPPPTESSSPSKTIKN